jgi:hypothetical protein
MKFTITFYVNNELTCTVENMPLDQVYSMAVPSEAFIDIPGNRWHVMLRQPTLICLREMEEGEYIKIAWQDAPLNPEFDTESTYVMCTE